MRTVPHVADGAITDREVGALTALNETLRDDYVADCQKGVDRWNRALAEVGFELSAAARRVQPQVGVFAGHHVSPDGRLLTDEEWRGGRRRLVADRRRPRPRRVADARRHRAGQSRRLGRRAVGRDPRRADRLRVRANLTTCDARRGADDDYNAAAWLRRSSRRRRPGRARRAYRVDGESTDYAGLQREVLRAQHAPSALDVRRGERVALVLDDELAFPAWFLGALRSGVVPVPLSTMLTANELAAIVGDALAGVVVLSAGYAGHVGAIAAADSELRHAVVIGDPAAGDTVPTHAWASFDRRCRGSRGDDDGGLAGVLVVQLGNDRPAQGRDAPPRQPAGDGRDVRPRGAGDRRRRPLPVGGQAVLRLRVGQLADVPAVGRWMRRPQPASADAAGGRRARPRRAADAVLRQPRLRRRPPRRRSAGRHVRLGARHRHRRRGAPRGSPSPLLGALRPSRARRHRHHRGAAHLPLERRRARSVPARAAGRCPATRPACVDDEGSIVASADTPGYLQVEGPSLATGYWSRDAATRAAFQGRVAGDGRRLHRLGRRLLDVPRAQQRHDQGGRDLGVAGRGRGRARSSTPTSSRPPSSGHAMPPGWRSPSPSSSPDRAAPSTRRRSTPTAASGWPGSSGRDGSTSSTSCRRRRPARSSGSACASAPRDAAP